MATINLKLAPFQVPTHVGVLLPKDSGSEEVEIAQVLISDLSDEALDGGMSEEFEDVMVTVYRNGELLNLTTLEEIRARVSI